MPTATTYLKSHKRADKRTALQSLKDRFDYGLNPEKLGAVSSYLCDPATAHAEFMLVKNQYQGETDRRAGHGALCYQIRQAFPHGEVTAEEANRIGYETAMRWTKGNRNLTYRNWNLCHFRKLDQLVVCWCSICSCHDGHFHPVCNSSLQQKVIKNNNQYDMNTSSLPSGRKEKKPLIGRQISMP